jgi:hypothetical protein
MAKAATLTALEQKALASSREAFQKTVVGRKLVAMEPRKVGDAKLTLDDGTVVLLRGDGSCCAFGSVKTLSEVIAGDHIITRVGSTPGESSGPSIRLHRSGKHRCYR